MSTQRADRVRIGDRERAAASDRLTAHAAAGRLDIQELEARLERAGAAVYDDELAAVEADLPSAVRHRQPAPWPSPPFVAVLLVAVVVAVAATAVVGHPFFPPIVAAFLLWRFGAFRSSIRRSQP